ncbi:3-deoxy-manno-octulosonate cytidylyltransferase [Algoriphagus marincola]|uniref:3-deoxy-manno-octulosonate cytidylyltransferase n=1 Tax=Algoriphagus marincola TaxID=264027 RepID=A0ABS7N0T4_9BACT|nr:3-deoxy-manno-octulosonate cytidylyltransferase [Algoriphagus marincola]MBY5949931.1 3-deoxy-manno-octulosonate cytidylyltransferase [Algoriphagus marincola]
MKIIGVIPARYKSSRFEGKPLALILGKPMIIHVAEKVEQALGKQNTYIATDDDRIAKLVESFGYMAIMTSESAKTGTDRLWDFAQQINADIYINVQGDEPMVSPNDIQKVVEKKLTYIDSVTCGMLPISNEEDPNDINIPKVLVNKNSDLIYMSRLPIPGIKNTSRLDKPNYLKQVCIYGFTYHDLKSFGELDKKAPYENFEDIEILRFFDLDISIKMVMMEKETIAVDNPKDIERVEKAMTQV